MKTITFERQPLKILAKMPANISKAIVAKVNQYAADPASLANNIKALKGFTGRYRLRVGDWRVIFDDNGRVIAIIRIAPRGSAYE